MTKRAKPEDDKVGRHLADKLAEMRMHSGLTQKEVARRMSTTQASIARLEGGSQSPSVRTLQDFARANGFCLEIGFIRSTGDEERLGCVMVIDDAMSGATITKAN